MHFYSKKKSLNNQQNTLQLKKAIILKQWKKNNIG